ncbi:MAG TPA: hypothetical protein VKR43_21635 [Bryobacteraceae bacterium]|nr:hypothetical protein [Bryobacteraceae bacterium]
MTPDESLEGTCGQIDDEAVELHVLGRLENGSVRTHLDTCPVCRERVAEQRSWIEDLKTALEQFRRTEDISPAGRGADYASRPDES